jgi:hypothetical protein
VSGRNLLGRQPVGAITIVETPVSQWYVQRARVAFLVAGVVSGVVTAAVVSVFTAMPLAVVLGILVGAVCGFVAAVLVRSWPVLRVLWWWFFEIAASAAVVLLPSSLARATRPWVALTAVVLVVAACVLVGPVRRFVSAWSWCLVVRHRLRVCFAGIVRGSGGVRPGSLPLILWARPTPAGERVWLWLRPGLELADLDGKTGRIAVVCIAKQVRVVPASEKYAGFVRVDIARRDPLAGRVDSPLALLIPSLRNTNTAVKPEASALPLVGLDLADIPEPAPEPPSRGGRR